MGSEIRFQGYQPRLGELFTAQPSEAWTRATRFSSSAL
jgi:hypothetical protein